MINLDYSKIPAQSWTYSSKDKIWNYGIEIHPKRGLIFWGERVDGDDAGSAFMSFEQFLKTSKFSTPVEIIDEIRKILEAALIKRK